MPVTPVLATFLTWQTALQSANLSLQRLRALSVNLFQKSFPNTSSAKRLKDGVQTKSKNLQK
nr:MAG TPA: hypothetical protein [Caudoviricetes sp.]